MLQKRKKKHGDKMWTFGTREPRRRHSLKHTGKVNNTQVKLIRVGQINQTGRRKKGGNVREEIYSVRDFKMDATNHYSV